MKTRQRLSAGLAICGLLVLAVPKAQAADLSGIWLANYQFPHMGGTDEITLVLKKAEKTYSGIISDAIGYIPKDTPLADVKLVDNALSFSFKMMDGATLVAKLTVADNKMTGQIEMGTMSFPIEFVFVKKS